MELIDKLIDLFTNPETSFGAIFGVSLFASCLAILLLLTFLLHRLETKYRRVKYKSSLLHPEIYDMEVKE